MYSIKTICIYKVISYILYTHGVYKTRGKNYEPYPVNLRNMYSGSFKVRSLADYVQQLYI